MLFWVILFWLLMSFQNKDFKHLTPQRSQEEESTIWIYRTHRCCWNPEVGEASWGPARPTSSFCREQFLLHSKALDLKRWLRSMLATLPSADPLRPHSALASGLLPSGTWVWRWPSLISPRGATWAQHPPPAYLPSSGWGSRTFLCERSHDVKPKALPG